MRGKILKIIAAVLSLTVLSLAFTISSSAAKEDDLWYKCTLDTNNRIPFVSGTVYAEDGAGQGQTDSYKFNLSNLAGSGDRDSFNTYYWKPFTSFTLTGEADISIEFRLQYDGFADAMLNGYTQCRRIELLSTFYVQGSTLYDYTINFVNGDAVIPLYYEAIKGDSWYETPISYWSDFEIDPSAYFSISFNIPYDSSLSDKYLFLYIFDFGNIIWLEKPSLKNQAGINDSQDKLDRLESAMDQPEPDIDLGLNSIIDKESDLSSAGSIFTGKGTFYAFVTSLMIVGVSLGLVGYVLHGKK